MATEKTKVCVSHESHADNSSTSGGPHKSSQQPDQSGNTPPVHPCNGQQRSGWESAHADAQELLGRQLREALHDGVGCLPARSRARTLILMLCGETRCCDVAENLQHMERWCRLHGGERCSNEATAHSIRGDKLALCRRSTAPSTGDEYESKVCLPGYCWPRHICLHTIVTLPQTLRKCPLSTTWRMHVR